MNGFSIFIPLDYTHWNRDTNQDWKAPLIQLSLPVSSHRICAEWCSWQSLVGGINPQVLIGVEPVRGDRRPEA